MVKYSYDAYGKCTLVSDTSNASIGSINPFRFKGYYLDSETGFYYCNSRYFVPDWGRWFTADSINYLDSASVNGMNLYVYCDNNPIMYKQGFVSSSFVDISSLPIVVLPVITSDSFRNGLLFGSGHITEYYADWNVRTQFSIRKGSINLGVAGKFSLFNVSGQIGLGTDDLNSSLKVIGDFCTVTGMARIFIDTKKIDYFVGVEAKATLLSGRIGTQLDIHGFQIEIRISGELGSIGGRLGVGLKHNKNGQMVFYFGAGLSALVGLDIYIRIRVDNLFR